MAKANLVLSNGTKVTIEGSAEEVAVLLASYSDGKEIVAPSSRKKSRAKKRSSNTGKPPKSKKKGPTGLILELKDENFFKRRRNLADIQKKLEEKGHIYAQTSLSPTLLRLVKKRKLRRVPGKKGWDYVI